MSLEGVHHDGSSVFVSRVNPALGDEVTVRLWTSHDCRPQEVTLRTVVDGEPLAMTCTPELVPAGDTWWSVSLPIANPRMHYRWLLTGGAFEYSWLTAAGLFPYDVPDATDFVIGAHGMAPDWALSAVVYQVYPDRFARSGDKEQIAAVGPPAGVETPEWLIPRAWSDRPEGRGPNTPHEYFGGDLQGVREHLDHIKSLGATIVYLTPMFPAESTHRYDARSFDEIDPLLGGDEALTDLVSAAHGDGLRVLGDITLNHCGRSHPWFQRALQGADPERDYFFFGDEFEHGYASWWDVPSLPKFDYSSSALREALLEGVDSPFRRWISGEHALDGWRVDVANMAGRLGSADVTLEVARSARRVIDESDGDLLLVAEHGHDASDDLVGDGWHGTMNYAGFTRQVWSWLRCSEFNEPFLGLPVAVPTINGLQFVASLRAFHGRIAWQQLLASWNILSSHDTARIRTVVGSTERQVAAMALAVGLPGVPMVFAGDEIGEQGWWGEDSRTPFPWHEPSTWDRVILEAYRELIGLRTSTPALQTGGLRWVHVQDDAVAFLRMSPHQRILVVVARSQCAAIRIPIATTDSVRRLFGFSGDVEGSHLVVPIPHAGASIWELS